MNGRWQRVAEVGATAFLLAGGLAASDPPHWLGRVEATDCTSACHTLHQAAGGQLTAAAQNAALCQSCHNSNALPITDAMKAAPGSRTGTSHAFGVPAVHATYGTQIPANTQMSLRVMDGKIVCSTCHNQHAASSAMGGTPRIGTPQRVLGTGNGTMTASGTYTGSAGLWYLLEIQTPGAAGTATFRWSLDNGTSWMAQNVVSGANVALNNGVAVTFTSGSPANQSFLAGDQWELSASWPFLRAKLDSGDNATGDKFCRDCHASWVMTHTEVNSWDGNYKSHPVGEGLAGGSSSNRAAPLDGNGSTESDGNTTNDLRLFGGSVQCLTCHAVHYADSNTATVDQP